MRVAYTPGHASHHVCYLHEESGTAFTGDVAAAAASRPRTWWSRRPRRLTSTSSSGRNRSAIVEAWRARAAGAHPLRRGRGPGRAPGDGPRAPARGGLSSAHELSEEDYERRHRERVEQNLEPEGAAELLQAVPPQYQWRGLDRYWRKARGTSATAELGEVLAHPLDRLGDPIVGGRQRDAEEALAAGPVHRAGRDDTAASSRTSSAKEVEVWPSGTGAQT